MEQLEDLVLPARRPGGSALLQGIVEGAPSPKPAVNLITHNRVFDAVAGNSAGKLDGSSSDAAAVSGGASGGGAILATPGVVHFGGFTPGAVHCQVVRLVNASAVAALRAHMIPPESPYFKVTHKRCSGAILPGLSEQLVVEFCPDQLRYYYDMIRVHSSGGNLLIPLHGYPVPNAPAFPRRVDFGRTSVGERAVRRLVLRCRVPMEFEFSVRVVKRSAALSVTPAAGMIPAGGAAEVEVAFQPLRHQTEEMRFEVNVAEFGAKPVVCTVTGSACPGLARDRELRLQMQQLAGDTAAEDAGCSTSGDDGACGGGNDHSPKSRRGEGATASSPKKGRSSRAGTHGWGGARSPGGGGGGARGDAFSLRKADARARTAATRDCRRDGPIALSLPRLLPHNTLLSTAAGAGAAGAQAPAADQPGLEVAAEVQEGSTFVPMKLRGHGDINYTLNQQPGKLRTKDVKAAIAARRVELVEEQRALSAIAAARDTTGVDALDQPGLAASLKEALFQLQLRRADDASKRCTGLVGAGGDVVGEDAPAAADVAAAREARAAAAAAHQLALEEAATHRLEAELAETGALHVVARQAGSVAPSGRDGAAAGPTSDQQQQQQQQQLLLQQDLGQQQEGAGPGPASAAAAGGCSGYAGLEGFAPQWVLLESNHWRKRVQVMQRFVGAARAVIYRLRADKRLRQLKGLKASMAGDRAGMAGAAAQALLAQSTRVERPGVEPSLLARPELIDANPIRPHREDLFYDVAADILAGAAGAAGAGQGYADWDQLEPEPYASEFEYKLLGYAPEDMPGLIPYLPPPTDVPLMSGAPEDGTAPRPAAPLPREALAAALGGGMPDALRQMPLASLEIGSRYAGGDACAAMQPVWGVDRDHQLQPALLPARDSARAEAPGSCGVRALAGAPLLAQRWLPAQGPWQAEPFQPPAPLGRADPSELLVDRDEDADKPRPPPPDLGGAAMAAFIPPEAAEAAEAAALVAGTEGPAARARQAGGQGQQQQGRRPAQGRRAARAPLPGQRAAAALDAAKEAARDAAVVGLAARADAFNGLLDHPHQGAVKL